MVCLIKKLLNKPLMRRLIARWWSPLLSFLNRERKVTLEQNFHPCSNDSLDWFLVVKSFDSQLDGNWDAIQHSYAV